MKDATPQTQAAVTVAVCTFRRNAQLAALVRLIDRILIDDPPGGLVRMVIVDDSPERGAAGTVKDLSAEVTLRLEYHASVAGDISVARNLALDSACVGSNFVACLDDDCLPHPGWLRELLRVANETQADVVVGHRQFVAAPESPRWLREQPFLDENLIYVDGSIPDRGNTANMLVRSSWFRASTVRFRAEMGTVGGEDMVFFSDATKAAANIRFAAASVCHEPCDGHRATYRYQCWRQLWLGNNEAIINRATRQATRRRQVARGARRVLIGPTQPLLRLARRQSPQWHWAFARSANGLGLLLGVIGCRLRHHS